MNTRTAQSQTPPASKHDALDDLLPGLSELISSTLHMAPSKLSPFTPLMNPSWVLSASSRLVRQFRELNVNCQGNPRSADGTGMVSDEPEALTPMAMAHAWMLALAQRGAVDIRQLESDEQRGVSSHGVAEINGVALFAGCTNRARSGDRLVKALRNVAKRTLQLCDERGARAAFVFGKAIQAVSPMTKQTALPFTACRVRAEGISVAQLLEVLREAIRSAGGEADKPTGELLVMSNLWLEQK